jgi:hypothetical protein
VGVLIELFAFTELNNKSEKAIPTVKAPHRAILADEALVFIAKLLLDFRFFFNSGWS